MTYHKEAFAFGARLYKQAGGEGVNVQLGSDIGTGGGSPRGLDHHTLMALAAGGLIGGPVLNALLGSASGAIAGHGGHNGWAGVGGGIHGGIGGAIGAGGAPPGHRIEGAGRGQWIQHGAVGGGLLGGLGGAGVGALIGHSLGANSEGTLGSALGGGLSGAAIGAYGGGKLTQHALGKPSWEEDQQ